MQRYQLILAYDGTSYAGWQVQPNGPSIQSLVQKALETVLRHPIQLTGAGRTDAGVHAEGQSAHFDSHDFINLFRVHYAANSLLPANIRILQIHPVASDFHARYSAKGKIYQYHFHPGRETHPTKRAYRHELFGPFNKEALIEATQLFLGTHDFKTFANTGSKTIGSVRTIQRIDLIAESDGFYLEFEGNGFLYKMVRNIAGTLFEVARETRKPNEIPHLLKTKDRTKAGASAPAKGLTLKKVIYSPSDSKLA